MLPALIATKVAKSNALAVASRFGFFTLLAVGAYLLIRKLVKTLQKNGYMSSFGTDTAKGRAVQYATQLYSAMFSGPEWMSDFFGDGTDEKAILSTAQEIFNDKEVTLAIVQAAYKTLYARELVMDLQKEMDSGYFQKFRKILNEGLAGLEMPSMLVVVSPAVIYDKNFKALNQAAPKTLLGSSYETLLTADGSYEVFYFNNQPRLVNTKDVNHLPYAA